MTTHVFDAATMPDEARKLFRSAFPSYNGRKFQLRGVDGPVDLRSYWDGGSRDYYALVRFDGAVLDMPAQSAFDPAVPSAGAYNIPEGVAVVEHSIFCGKDMGLTIIVPQSRLAAFLPAAAAPELTDRELSVLLLVRSYIPKCRREYAAANGIKAAEYDSIVASLKAKGMLAGNGGITPAGRNLTSNMRDR